MGFPCQLPPTASACSRSRRMCLKASSSSSSSCVFFFVWDIFLFDLACSVTISPIFLGYKVALTVDILNFGSTVEKRLTRTHEEICIEQ